jgi:F0F1-type ATP synthase alpha subunit
LIKQSYLDKIDIKRINYFERALLTDLSQSQSEMLNTIKTKKSISPEFEKEMHSYMAKFISSFK